MSRAQTTGDRLMELELRFMEQQAVIDALDAVVKEQADELTALARQLRHLEQLLQQGHGDPADE